MSGGSIPARAGKPFSSVTSESSAGVYPRAGGETAIERVAINAWTGLSPRGRGNRVRYRHGHSRSRSIPARAGKPRNPLFAIMPPGVYPARAGKPDESPPDAASHAVYPRAGGETAPSWTSHPLISGLSPRGRGNRRGVAVAPGDEWSIPARAGKPTGGCWQANAWWVYPRAGGETVIDSAFQQPMMGLSPRGRGNRAVADAPGGVRRSIPARAGKPRPVTTIFCCHPVYPRAGGETPDGVFAPVLSVGLSPRGRGNPGQNGSG